MRLRLMLKHDEKDNVTDIGVHEGVWDLDLPRWCTCSRGYIRAVLDGLKVNGLPPVGWRDESLRMEFKAWMMRVRAEHPPRCMNTGFEFSGLSMFKVKHWRNLQIISCRSESSNYW